MIPLVSLFSEENSQTGFPETQPSPVGLPPACREFLFEGPLEQSYEGVGLGERQVPRVCMVVLSEACPQPQFVSDEAHGPAGRVVRQLSGGCPDSSTEVSGQEDISLYSYSPEELARKQRIEPALLLAGRVPGVRKLCLRIFSLFCLGQKKSVTIWSGGSLEWIRRELPGVIWRVSSPDPDGFLAS